ncbi:hypothetical protein Pcinc_028233 [Petrolisthes cinctipes]|uniref:Uncharacterized protein n=1 Tax=Petrolisthes cinctipes TaxID=88211 RepID=A0AAE1F3Z9_PETCI|nr:hypothetical protein Pcinc_028233 [Petrolisthes cinctipes]
MGEDERKVTSDWKRMGEDGRKPIQASTTPSPQPFLWAPQFQPSLSPQEEHSLSPQHLQTLSISPDSEYQLRSLSPQQLSVPVSPLQQTSLSPPQQITLSSPQQTTLSPQQVTHKYPIPPRAPSPTHQHPLFTSQRSPLLLPDSHSYQKVISQQPLKVQQPEVAHHAPPSVLICREITPTTATHVPQPSLHVGVEEDRCGRRRAGVGGGEEQMWVQESGCGHSSGRVGGMLGMVLSVVGNCMRSVEPARKNLIEDPELVTEAHEEPSSSSSASSSSSVNSRHGLQETPEGCQQEGRGGGGGGVVAVNNNLYIIEEYTGVEENGEDRNRDAVVSVSSHSGRSPILAPLEVAHVHSTNYHYHRNNNNNYTKNNKNSKTVSKNGSGKVDKVKGSTTNKRPLVLVCETQTGIHPNHHHNHHHHHKHHHSHSHHGPVTAGKCEGGVMVERPVSGR